MRFAILAVVLAICTSGLAQPLSSPIAPESPAKSAWPIGKYVELLPTVDVHRGRIGGEITRTGDGLVIAPKPKDWGRVVLPVTIDGSYELHLNFTIYASDGHKGMVLILPVGSRRCIVVLNAWSATISGLGRIDDQGVDNNLTTVHGDIFPKPRRYIAVIKVQVDGDDVNIHVKAAGRDLVDWSGKLESLDLKGWSPKIRSPQVGDDASTVVLHSAQLKLMSGIAAWAEPDATVK